MTATYYTQATSIADSAGKLRVAYPLHSSLYNRHLVLSVLSSTVMTVPKLTSDAECPGKFCVERHGCIFSLVCGYLRGMERREVKEQGCRSIVEYLRFCCARYQETSRRLSFMWGSEWTEATQSKRLIEHQGLSDEQTSIVVTL